VSIGSTSSSGQIPRLPLCSGPSYCHMTLGMYIYFRSVSLVGPARMTVFGLVMFTIQGYMFFGPPPASDKSAAVTALVAYAIFALVVRFLEAASPPAQIRLTTR
jgi:hypothetical protein